MGTIVAKAATTTAGGRLSSERSFTASACGRGLARRWAHTVPARCAGCAGWAGGPAASLHSEQLVGVVGLLVNLHEHQIHIHFSEQVRVAPVAAEVVQPRRAAADVQQRVPGVRPRGVDALQQ